MSEAKAKVNAEKVIRPERFINWKAFQQTMLDILPVNALKGKAMWLGIFVYLYLGIGGGFITSCLFLNINPTLILSIIGAPIWIGLVFLSKKLTDIVYEYRTIDESNTKD